MYLNKMASFKRNIIKDDYKIIKKQKINIKKNLKRNREEDIIEFNKYNKIDYTKYYNNNEYYLLNNILHNIENNLDFLNDNKYLLEIINDDTKKRKLFYIFLLEKNLEIDDDILDLIDSTIIPSENDINSDELTDIINYLFDALKNNNSLDIFYDKLYIFIDNINKINNEYNNLLNNIWYNIENNQEIINNNNNLLKTIDDYKKIKLFFLFLLNRDIKINDDILDLINISIIPTEYNIHSEEFIYIIDLFIDTLFFNASLDNFNEKLSIFFDNMNNNEDELNYLWGYNDDIYDKLLDNIWNNIKKLLDFIKSNNFHFEISISSIKSNIKNILLSFLIIEDLDIKNINDIFNSTYIFIIPKEYEYLSYLSDEYIILFEHFIKLLKNNITLNIFYNNIVYFIEKIRSDEYFYEYLYLK